MESWLNFRTLTTGLRRRRRLTSSWGPDWWFHVILSKSWGDPFRWFQGISVHQVLRHRWFHVIFSALFFGESLQNTNFGDLWAKFLLEIVAPICLWRPSQLSFVTLEYKLKNIFFQASFYLLLFSSARWRRRHQQLQIANFSSGKSGVFSSISNTINSNQVSLW